MEWAAALSLFNYACIGFALLPRGMAWLEPRALVVALPLLARCAAGADSR
jgi:hypothetical protein